MHGHLLLYVGRGEAQFGLSVCNGLILLKNSKI